MELRLSIFSGGRMRQFEPWQPAREVLLSLESRYVFRGMRSAEWDLLTTLDRSAIYHHTDAEAVLINSFKCALTKAIDHPPPAGKTVTALSLPTKATYKKDGGRQERTEWHRIECWGSLGE